MPPQSFDVKVMDLIQAIGLLVRRVRQTVASQQLSLSESTVLARLEREGPATTAELARAEGVRPQSMRSTVASLEERGLIVRTAHPTDGRQMNIELTEEGLALRRTTKSAKQMWLAQAIAKLDKAEQETLFAAAAIIKRLVKL